MFIAAPFTIVRTWSNLNVHQQKKMSYINPMEYYSAIKTNEVGSFVEMWMDLETVTQSKISKKEKHKYCILTYICGIQKNGTDDLICKIEIETHVVF